MYPETTVKTNINIDVLNVIQSDKCSRVRIIAAAMAPITRIEEWPKSTWYEPANPLFEIVKERCHAHPEYRWLPYDQLITELAGWIKTKDVSWRIKVASYIPVIDRYDNMGLAVNEKMVKAYSTIRDGGRYTKIDYKTSGEYFLQKRQEKLEKQKKPANKTVWQSSYADITLDYCVTIEDWFKTDFREYYHLRNSFNIFIDPDDYDDVQYGYLEIRKIILPFIIKSISVDDEGSHYRVFFRDEVQPEDFNYDDYDYEAEIEKIAEQRKW